MAAAVTVTEEAFGSVKKVQWSWTSNASGDVTDAPSGLTTTFAYSGKIEMLVTDPGATAPTTLYDVTVVDADGYDVLAGAGANRSATVTESVISSSLGIVANDVLALTITNAGASTVGTVTVFIR